MKKNFLILFFIMFVSLNGYAFANNLYPINDNKGGGYIDKQGKIIIEQKYNFAYGFIGKYAIVEDKNHKKGVIDKKENVVVDFINEDLVNLSEDMVFYKENGKFGLIDINKKVKFKPLYDKVRSFKEGLAGINIKGKWGYINKKGEIQIEPKYYKIADFSGSLAGVSFKDYQTAGYINKKGKMVISFEENNLEPKEFKEGLAPIIKGEEKSCSYINKRGKVVIDNKKIYPKNIYCGNFSEGLNVFYIDENQREITTGFVDKKGNIKYSMLFMVPDSFSSGEFSVFEGFSSNMAQMMIDYKTGYISRDFKVKIPFLYEFARDFIGDLAYVKYEDKEGYINKKGVWVWSKVREGM